MRSSKALTLIRVKLSCMSSEFKPIRCVFRFNRTNSVKKWALTFEEYPLDSFPPYNQGNAYVVSHAVMLRILAVSAQPKGCHDGQPQFLRMEDVYVGLCALAAKIKPLKDPEKLIRTRLPHWKSDIP